MYIDTAATFMVSYVTQQTPLLFFINSRPQRLASTFFWILCLCLDFMFSGLKNVLLLAAWASSNVMAIQTVSRAGQYLYTQNQSRFYIKGVAYQPQGHYFITVFCGNFWMVAFAGAVVASAGNNFQEPSSFIDPLALDDGCKRDLPYLQQLGINTIRVYSVNSSLNHDSCMATFSNAGIYTM